MVTNKRPRKPRDNKREQIEQMFRAEGVAPKRSLVNWLLRLWAKDTGAAQAYGVTTRKKIEKGE